MPGGVPPKVVAQEEGVEVGRESTLNFVGSNITVSHDASNARLTVTVTGVGSGDMLKSTYDPNEDGVIAAAQLDTSLLTTAHITGDPHVQYLRHSLSTAANDFLVATVSGVYIAQTLAQTLSLLGKAVSGGLASLDGSSLVVQNPANAVTGATANKIPIADTSGHVTAWVITGDTTRAGLLEAAISTEVNAGVDATRAVTPDALAGSNVATKMFAIELQVTGSQVSGTGIARVMMPQVYNNWRVIEVGAWVGAATSVSGTPTFDIYNQTLGYSLLSTLITIDPSESGSNLAAVPPVINVSNNLISAGNIIRIDKTAVGVSEKGDGVYFVLQMS